MLIFAKVTKIRRGLENQQQKKSEREKAISLTKSMTYSSYSNLGFKDEKKNIN